MGSNAMTPEQREKRREYMRKWNAEHKEERAAAAAAYREKYRDTINRKHLEYYRKYRDLINANRRWRFAHDDEYRARVLEQQHKRNRDPENRERNNARQRERRHTDDYRAKTALQRRLRYASDPEFRARVLEGGRRYRERRKGEGGCGTAASSQG